MHPRDLRRLATAPLARFGVVRVHLARAEVDGVWRQRSAIAGRYQLAMVHGVLGNVNEAIELFEAVVKLQPKYLPAHVGVANVWVGAAATQLVDSIHGSALNSIQAALSSLGLARVLVFDQQGVFEDAVWITRLLRLKASTLAIRLACLAGGYTHTLSLSLSDRYHPNICLHNTEGAGNQRRVLISLEAGR